MILVWMKFVIYLIVNTNLLALNCIGVNEEICKNIYYSSPSPSIIAIHSSIDNPFSNAITNFLYSSLY